MDKNRKTAFDALLEIQTKKAYSNIAVNRAVTKNIPDDEAFVRNLVYGVLENQIFIDHRLSQLMKQKLKKVNPKALTLLRMGAYQLEFADSVPAYAAINESVNIAKKVAITNSIRNMIFTAFFIFSEFFMPKKRLTSTDAPMPSPMHIH